MTRGLRWDEIGDDELDRAIRELLAEGKIELRCCPFCLRILAPGDSAKDCGCREEAW